MAGTDGVESTWIDAAVVEEAQRLNAEGTEVVFEDTVDPFPLKPSTQRVLDAEIAEMERATLAELSAERANPMLLLEGRTAMAAWQPLTKRAVALHNIYNPLIATLGDGIDSTLYRKPLLESSGGPQSAHDLLAERIGPEKAESVLAAYEAFLSEPIDDRSRLIWQGAKDGQGVRTRAVCAMEAAAAHLSRLGDGRPVTIVSLACGAAEPVYRLADRLQATSGAPEIRRLVLADSDPMALATARALAAAHDVEHLLDLRCVDLVDTVSLSARDLGQILPGDADVIDLLGIFEYFPAPLATDMLAASRRLLSPDGLIVFGNMLEPRPQQAFFEHVSLWPPLHQRSLRELVRIVAAAGFEPSSQMRIHLPPQGVYAVVTLVPR